jgi:hypothetical protein
MCMWRTQSPDSKSMARNLAAYPIDTLEASQAIEGSLDDIDLEPLIV